MSKKLVVANWKMNGNIDFVKEFFNSFSEQQNRQVETVFCPPFPLIQTIQNYAKAKIGAQDCHHEEKGAYTGEVSSQLLSDFNVDYVIVGHSERREYHKETSGLVNKKASSAIKNGILPIICVGETLEERNNDTYKDVISTQIVESVPNHINADKLIVAYEPVWSIGTGKIPGNGDILEVFEIIREKLQDHLIDRDIDIDKVRILYGGSVNSGNCDTIKGISYLGGYLVGSASLKPAEFNVLVQSLEG